jgi:hypothetical protein
MQQISSIEVGGLGVDSVFMFFNFYFLFFFYEIWKSFFGILIKNFFKKNSHLTATMDGVNRKLKLKWNQI